MLTSMKRTVKKEDAVLANEPYEEEYPYGLCIDLDEESLGKLGITSLPKVGTAVMVSAKCKVKSISASEHDGGEKMSHVSLQITDMRIGDAATPSEDKASLLYG